MNNEKGFTNCELMAVLTVIFCLAVLCLLALGFGTGIEDYRKLVIYKNIDKIQLIEENSYMVWGVRQGKTQHKSIIKISPITDNRGYLELENNFSIVEDVKRGEKPWVEIEEFKFGDTITQNVTFHVKSILDIEYVGDNK
jgi:hypothetical protein